MSKKEKAGRYAVFAVGLMFSALGVAVAAKADLGVSPLVSIPYALSLVLPKLSLGIWTLVFCLIMIGSQLVMLRGKMDRLELAVQLIMAVCFGNFVDIALMFLTWLEPVGMLLRILTLMVSCVIVALGAAIGVMADVAMLPGDAFIRVLARKIGKEYGVVRLPNDVIMSVTAGLLCIIIQGRLAGVGIGTVISAVCIGPIVRFISRWLLPLGEKLFSRGKTKPRNR